MYFQFLIEDRSTEILVGHVMEKLQLVYPEQSIYFNTKAFTGIGNLRTKGDLMERKGGNLLDNLYRYLRGFDRCLQEMNGAAIVIILDNDRRDTKEFMQQLERVAQQSIMITDHVFCVAVKEMEAWLLGDENAIMRAYPNAKTKFLSGYEQDGLVDTWEVLANMIYPGGLAELKKKSKKSYSATGKAKCEWADNIGRELCFEENISPSFQHFIQELKVRMKVA
ncbi:DUF4276 family protein [Anaerovorax odorimutans]|uniref:DUF4276 family protein n=1 Tax=Anaerovorax odorimutans TaxID=109327 RepID=A0ABT1RP25_9FIRM|nr:DUF4276 family protein [Anaerovorax odorimutans]MCQ4636944.1 DUF4276 family protein [Anaerovorax odorimutans]